MDNLPSLLVAENNRASLFKNSRKACQGDLRHYASRGGATPATP